MIQKWEVGRSEEETSARALCQSGPGVDSTLPSMSPGVYVCGAHIDLERMDGRITVEEREECVRKGRGGRRGDGPSGWSFAAPVAR